MSIAPPQIDFDHPTGYRDELRSSPSRVRLLVIPERRYLVADGHGRPGADSFPAAMAALYPVAFALHFDLRRRGIAEPVGAVELVMCGRPKDPDMRWRLQLPVPETAGEEDLAGAISLARQRRSSASVDGLRVERIDEGLVAQILHVGPYSAEELTIEALHGAIAWRGLRPRRCHHEIYISDPKKTAPERLKTVIRQPVEWA